MLGQMCMFLRVIDVFCFGMQRCCYLLNVGDMFVQSKDYLNPKTLNLAILH